MLLGNLKDEMRQINLGEQKEVPGFFFFFFSADIRMMKNVSMSGLSLSA